MRGWDWQNLQGGTPPLKPKMEKIQDLPPGLEFSSENDYFKRATHQGLIVVGILKVKIEIEVLKRDSKFHLRLFLFSRFGPLAFLFIDYAEENGGLTELLGSISLV